MAVLTTASCTAADTSVPGAEPATRSSAVSPTPHPGKSRADVTADLRAAGDGLGTYKDMNSHHTPGSCMVSAWRLSRQVPTTEQAEPAAERLQRRGWKLDKKKGESASLTSGDWIAALAPGPIPEEFRAELAPHEGVLIFTAMGKCVRRP
ncbi:hypothetical protein GCM10009864_34530 [Streptomyces lunalinharesii]|uniref:Lipoprotein n=2 Tax=Streptomyces lunalinharesii TaxID=333384 RepID=A0ABN3S280_9ACTN